MVTSFFAGDLQKFFININCVNFHLLLHLFFQIQSFEADKPYADWLTTHILRNVF